MRDRQRRRLTKHDNVECQVTTRSSYKYGWWGTLWLFQARVTARTLTRWNTTRRRVNMECVSSYNTRIAQQISCNDCDLSLN